MQQGFMQKVGSSNINEGQGNSRNNSVDVQQQQQPQSVEEADSVGVTPAGSADDLVKLVENEELSVGADGVQVALALDKGTSTTSTSSTTTTTSTTLKEGEEEAQRVVWKDKKDKDKVLPVLPASIIVAEDRERGDVKASTYAAYVEKLGGSWMVALIIFLMLGAQVLAIFCNLFLATWSRKSFVQQQQTHYLVTYSILVAAAIVIATLRALVAFKLSIRAAQRLHNAMVRD